MALRYCFKISEVVTALWSYLHFCTIISDMMLDHFEKLLDENPVFINPVWKSRYPFGNSLLFFRKFMIFFPDWKSLTDLHHVFLSVFLRLYAGMTSSINGSSAVCFYRNFSSLNTESTDHSQISSVFWAKRSVVTYGKLFINQGQTFRFSSSNCVVCFCSCSCWERTVRWSVSCKSV